RIETKGTVVVAVVRQADPVALLMGGLLVGARLLGDALGERVVLEVGEARVEKRHASMIAVSGQLSAVSFASPKWKGRGNNEGAVGSMCRCRRRGARGVAPGGARYSGRLRRRRRCGSARSGSPGRSPRGALPPRNGRDRRRRCRRR